jgi:hypothetical protein
VKKLTPVDFPPWTLPLLAVAISVPVIAAFALAGPAAGMAAGALVAAVIIGVAARARFDEEIEVAPATGAAGGVLVVATAAIEGSAAVEAIRRARAGAGGEAADVLVLAPALNRTISHWLSDLRGARLGAQERLAVSLAVLAAAGIDARGQVGDTDPVQAIEDTLRSFPAAEVVFVTSSGAGGDLVAEVRRRLDRPVTHEIGDDPGSTARESRERTRS